MSSSVSQMGISTASVTLSFASMGEHVAEFLEGDFLGHAFEVMSL
jgi:hypothetical protein